MSHARSWPKEASRGARDPTFRRIRSSASTGAANTKSTAICKTFSTLANDCHRKMDEISDVAVS